jgi:hypothetical protein
MLSMRKAWTAAFALVVFAMLGHVTCHAQAALLLEQPYGLYGAINPTGHNAIYLARVCPETPVHLRRCRPGELGSVISRYEGVDGYDWVAIPLVPYLYSVEDASQVPDRVNHELVDEMRNRYRESHFDALGMDLSGGSYVREGWKQLIGAAYERRIYAFRFETTPEQDDALIAELNSRANRSHFHMLYRNCADFARVVLNHYFPRTFHRSIFPDAGVTTPKQITYKLARYARKHPELELTVFEIPQVPGYRMSSRTNKDIAESFSTTPYALPITLINPYLFGGIFVDYLVRGRYHLIPKDPQVVEPNDLFVLTESGAAKENLANAGVQAPGAAFSGSAETQTNVGANSGLREIKAAHE